MSKKAKFATIVAKENEDGSKDLFVPFDSNPDWASVRLDQIVTSFAGGRFIRRRRTAFNIGTVKEFEAAIEAGELYEGQKIHGVIQRQLSTESFLPEEYDGSDEVINPETEEGKGFYQRFELVEDQNAPTETWVSEAPTSEAPAEVQAEADADSVEKDA